VAQIASQIHDYGTWLVFAVVFAQQLGLPIPSTPFLLMAGAYIYAGTLGFVPVMIAVVSAAVAADLIWFYAGRKYGYQILGLLCRMSMSPESCVRTTEITFEKWGGLTLAGSKFLPGLSTVAAPLAGALGYSTRLFLLYDLLGASLFAGICILVGFEFHESIEKVLALGNQIGLPLAILLTSALAIFLAYKWLRRWIFLRNLRAERISVLELSELIRTEPKPLIVDVRNIAVQMKGRIPGAIALSIEEFEQRISALPAGSEIILYCACPNEAAAAKIAIQLKRRGFLRVRPLLGGLDAWVEAGYSLEIAQ